MKTFKESETSSDQRKAADRPKGHAAPLKNNKALHFREGL